jgi:hypothetical protein
VAKENLGPWASLRGLGAWETVLSGEIGQAHQVGGIMKVLVAGSDQPLPVSILLELRSLCSAHRWWYLSLTNRRLSPTLQMG